LQRAAGALVQQHKTKERRPEHLGLLQHRGQRRRHADLEREKQNAELPHALKEAVKHDPFPGDFGRAHQQHQRQHREHIAGGAQLEGREVAQREFHHHKIDAPQHDHREGGGQVAARQGVVLHRIF
jgi:hypothetical protein